MSLPTGKFTLPILRVLVGSDKPVMAAQIHRAIVDGGTQGSPAGVTSAVLRLAHHGVLSSDMAGNRTVYSFNPDHILADAVRELLKADQRTTMEQRRAHFERTPPDPTNTDHSECRQTWGGGIATYESEDGLRCRWCQGPVVAANPHGYSGVNQG